MQEHIQHIDVCPETVGMQWHSHHTEIDKSKSNAQNKQWRLSAHRFSLSGVRAAAQVTDCTVQLATRCLFSETDLLAESPGGHQHPGTVTTSRGAEYSCVRV